MRSGSRILEICCRYVSAFLITSSRESCFRVSDLPVGSPIMPVKSPITSWISCPRSWNCLSFCSATVWPMWMSGLDGSSPIFTLSGRPVTTDSATFRASSSSGTISTVPRRMTASCRSTSSRWPGVSCSQSNRSMPGSSRFPCRFLLAAMRCRWRSCNFFRGAASKHIGNAPPAGDAASGLSCGKRPAAGNGLILSNIIKFIAARPGSQTRAAPTGPPPGAALPHGSPCGLPFGPHADPLFIRNRRLCYNGFVPQGGYDMANKLTGKQRSILLAKQTAFVAWLIVKWVIVCGLVAGFLAGGMIAGYVSALVRDEPVRSPEEMLAAINRYDQTGFVYFNDGTLIGQLRTSEDRRLVESIREIPKHVRDAFVSVEDFRFEQHFGIDIFGTLRA